MLFLVDAKSSIPINDSTIQKVIKIVAKDIDRLSKRIENLFFSFFQEIEQKLQKLFNGSDPISFL